MDIVSFNFMTDDGESVSVFLGDSIHQIDEEDNVIIQVPVFTDERSGVIYITDRGLSSVSRNTVVKEAMKWALRGRMSPKNQR
jgi:RNA polymerase subunit RPABC4/transcription elongation factor Spt4